MATSAVSNSTSAAATSAAGTTKATGMGELDRNAFLKLLIAQLRNQDPLKPLEDKEFIAQLAQFSSLEQMQNLSDSFSSGFTAFTTNQASAQAFGMIGHKIDYLDAKTGGKVQGTVDSVGVAGGVPKLNIGTTQVDLSSVVTVY